MTYVWLRDLEEDGIQLPDEVKDYINVKPGGRVMFESIAPGVCILRKPDKDEF